ncbi:MAG: response regulator [Bacteroidia bacterium]|nr:response regulator [Bacteroidia bacterium]
MKKLLIIVYSAFLVILLANFIYYRGLYNKQINYITTLLDRQVQIVGLSVDDANLNFISDLNKINNPEDLKNFFTDPASEARAIENMKLFYAKYQNLITSIKLYDNNKNEYTLTKEEDIWLGDQPFITHVQSKIIYPEQLTFENKRYNFYLPLLKDNLPVGNMVVTIDYQKYFEEIFSVFNLKDYQWQWVVGDSGNIVFNNSGNKITYFQIGKITSAIESGAISNLTHKATIDGKSKTLISSYYSTQLVTRNLGLVFSSPTALFQKYIVWNSLIIVVGTLLLIQGIIFLFWRYINSQRSEKKRLEGSEKMLFKLIEEMPVGVIIHNENREIIKANKVAATQYSFRNEEEMKGKIFPESSISDVSNYFSKNLGGSFDPEQFVIIKKEIGEIILFRNSIPVVFMGENANMELLIDVTMLESARKQEAKANVAKSEFLARMSYEIRTPLNGIIGMTDILNKQDLSAEIKDMIVLLRRSTEVLLNIINDILDFSKIETGKMLLDEIPFNIREEINYCTELANTYISAKDVVFTVNVDDKIPQSIIADPYRLRQVLSNLINHSSGNTEKGEIRLSCKLKSNNSGIITLQFELKDTGLSFDKASLKKIFGDFINIESKPVKSSDESGFGTILARQLVEMMGGELTAESPSGIAGDMGTKIIFSIVAYSNDRILKNLNHETLRRFDMVKTLVITGSQTRDEEVLSSLHKIGLNISITTFQKSTIGQIRENLNNPADKNNLLIILDDDNFNGFDVAMSIWENNLSGSVIIMIISSNDLKGNYMKCITMGVDHYIVRPFDNNELKNVIQDSFPFVESQHSSVDISNIKNDLNLLVIEDNKMNQKVITTMLKTLGYICDIANDGLAGLKMTRDKKYDLIFMDLIMPEMNGFDAARKILALDNQVLIVAFTADNMPDAKRKAELSGIREFITKPVRIEELKRLFAKYFRKSQ